MTSRPAWGVAFALAAAMLWGTTGTAQHFAPSQLSPYWIGALRLVIAAAFFGLWVAAAERASPQVASARAALVRSLLAGVCLAFYNLAFFAGVKLAGVAVGTTIAIGSGPLFAGAMQVAFTRRMPAGLWWLGTALAIAGGALVALGGTSELHIDGFGIALCLLAGLSYASYTLLAKSVARQASPARTNRLVFAAAAVVAVPLAWALSARGVGALAAASASGWLVVAYLGVMATGVSYLLFASALRHISGATGVALAQAEPLTAFMLAVLVLGEPLHVGGVVGMAAMLLGLALVVAGERRAAAASTM